MKEKIVLNVLTTKALDRQHYSLVFKVPCLVMVLCASCMMY